MKTRTIDYPDGNPRFTGHVAWDETAAGQRPGVLVFPEAWGLNDHARRKAAQLAELGYIAFAADLYGGGAVYDDSATLGPVIRPLYADRSEWRARARAALDALAAQPRVDAARIAAIGFCFGGATALELARTGAPLAAVATFHAGFVPELPEDRGRIRARVLICHGAEDTLVKRDTVDQVEGELRRDQVDWQISYYGNAAHGFTNEDAEKYRMAGLAYDRRADERSWAAMRRLFDDTFESR